MSEPDRVPLNWKQPPEWERYLSDVEETHGATALYAGFEIERAWMEYCEDHPAEESADHLVGAVGLPQREYEKENPTRESGHGTGRAGVRVRQTVKDEMAAHATETGVPNHEVLRIVVNWYLGGGVLGRVTEKLKRAVPLVEEHHTDDSVDDRGPKERRTDALTERLGGGDHAFTLDDFREALEAVESVSDSAYCRGEYLPRVCQRLGFTEHPKPTNDLFVSEKVANAWAEEQGVDLDAPAIDRKEYADLTDEERVHGLRIKLAGLAADRPHRKHALRASQVQRDVFDGTPGARKVKDLMDRAARADGFETDARGGEKRLRCNVEAASDDLQADAGVDLSYEEMAAVDAELDALTSARAATDGGVDR